MPPDERDSSYLWDMLDAARTIQKFTSGVTFDTYIDNRMMQLAVEREIEIIGEAARNVSVQFKDTHAEIPWNSIIAQRNVIAHEYGDIKHDRIWAVVTDHISELVVKLEPLIPPVPPKTD